MKCQFKNCGSKDDNPNFDNPVEHLIITMTATGHTHVHGPFDNEYVMRKFADSFMAEMEKNGMKYVPKTEHRIGD